ncbi:cytochrome P450 81E8-like [Vigna radiata var. radiata]|uniref:Cytochrome P450 81E8-like n=1 Tax=Vigna radiata var. radiata TaxID=3916 RepID=A0A1S3UE29_VIGRR|nr:cytochrome P450 81E8-like [Vigna radiata var. radiata]XP_014504204.1 cytochrome P450 81E8-like [Vigna radiata var. radiata]
MALLYYGLVIVVFVYSLKVLFGSRKLRNLPPGPFAYPIVGNLLQLQQPFHRYFTRLSKKHGKVFSLWFGNRLVIVASDLPVVQECFTKNDTVLANRPHFLLGKHISYNNSTILHSCYGEHWRHLRRILSLEVVSTHRLNASYDIRRDELTKLLQKLARISRNDFTKVDLKSMVMETSLNTMMRLVSGKRFYGDDCDVSDVEKAKEFRGILREMVSLAGVNNRGDFLPFMRWFDLDNLEKRLKNIGKRIDAFLQSLIDEIRASNKTTNTMISQLLVQQRTQPEQYSDQIIKGLCMSMLLAGTDTSALTLEWGMANLLNHPEVLKRAKEELDTHVGSDHLVEESDMSKLPYVLNIFFETIRLHPAAPLWSPHMSSEDCTIGGYNLPKNTILLVNAWSIHHDPTLWKNPYEFRPERFEKECDSSKLLSFGLGRRSCPGNNLAQRSVGLALASLIQCFEWQRIGKEDIDMTEAKGITISRQNPLEVMCKARQIPAVTDLY